MSSNHTKVIRQALRPGQVRRGSVRFTGVGGGGSVSESWPSGLVFDVDVTKSASYDGSSQTWANQVASPADGGVQTDYDFELGSSNFVASDDPVFNGSAGSASAYWSYNGAQNHHIKIHAQSDFMASLHKASAQFWVACVLRTSSATVGHYFFGNSNGTNQTGMTLQLSTGSPGTLQMLVKNGSTTVLTQTTNVGTIGQSGDYLVIVSFQEGTAGNIWVNGTKYTMASATYTSPSTSVGSYYRTSRGSSTVLPDTTRMYALSGGNVALTDQQAGNIRTIYATRHGRTY